jgi:hypothetical protein
MINKTVKPYATFTLLSLTLISVFSVMTLPSTNAVTSFDIGDTGQEKDPINMAKGGQDNLCDMSDSACKQVNEGQSAGGSDNKVVRLNGQSGPSLNKDKKGTGENSTDIIMKIDGIDHSTIKVKVWITTNNGQEISKTFNPIPLLDPEDDDRGIIFVPVQVDKGLLDTGDTYTGCIKVILDTDKYGNKQSCQQSVLKPADAQEASSSLRSASAANDDGGGSIRGAVPNNNGGVAMMSISL